MSTQIYNITQALDRVNPYREVMIEYDDTLIPVHSIYIQDNKLIITGSTVDNDCENCIHYHNDCPDDKPIEFNPHCEFISKDKIILYDQ